MKDWLIEFCGGNFMPHGQCYLWTPSLVWLHGLSDGLIALAYFSIPLALVYFVRRRRDVPYPRLFLMFGAFIVACGTTHALEVWTIWHSHYYLTGSVKALTAAISLATAVALVRIMPEALQIAGPGELRRLNESLEERVRVRTSDLEASNLRLREEIGQREQAEAEVNRLNQLLQRQVDELQSLLDVLPVGVGIARDAACRDVRMNGAFAQMLGIEVGEAAAARAPDFAGEGKIRLSREGRVLAPQELPMQRSVAENRAILGFQGTLVRGDGRALELLCGAVPLRDAGGRAGGCIATFQDVTALKTAQRANARYAAIVASSEDAVIGGTLDGIVTDWNHAAEKIFGYPATEIIGKSINVLSSDEAGREPVGRLAEMATREGAAPFDRRCRRKDGEIVEVSVLISPIRDESGAVIGFSKVARDITERRREERRRRELDLKLQETQRLEGLGVLAGGIAHDFNNILTGILGNASLAAQSLPASSPAKRYMHDIELASQRAAELCGQMLAYACRGRFVPETLDLNRLIGETTRLLGVSIGKKAELRRMLAPGLPPITADASQIRQIVMNLVINASEAIGERGGLITITTGLVWVDAGYLAQMRHAAEMGVGEHVFLEVNDNGGGMDAATLERIFDPFFTTKFTGRGLGLAAVQGIVRGHKGGLEVRSEEGRGSMFRLLLPAAADHAAKTPAAVVGDVVAYRGGGRVLVVDDEESVRLVAARMLESLGFSVEQANDGREGVAKFAADPAAYVLVILDLTMPHLNGADAFREMRGMRPEVRVVLMSGYGEHEAISGLVDQGLAGYVHKPFNQARFTAAIRKCLEG
jgi:PAS domain S-box-containing protein